jgi:uncharacterized membrane protein YciS (DUF1049 family)
MKQFGLQLLKFWREKISYQISSLLSVMWIGGLAITGIFSISLGELRERNEERQTNQKCKD